MSGLPSVARLCLIGAALAASVACEAGEPERPAPPPPAPSAQPTVTEPPPTARQPASFSSEDGAALAGDLFLAAPDAPAVVLVHRLFGDRSEWAPLVERLRRGKPRFSVLAFDLRGHGASKEPADAKKKTSEQKRELALDVRAAIAHVIERSQGKTPGVVLVGSSFGATLVSLVAFDEPKVTALGLISPGAAIRGVDIYRPYSEVRNLPTFVAGAEDDTISRDPLSSLAKMAMKPSVKRYAGTRHAAQFLAAEHAALWQDLETWLRSVHGVRPEPRRSLYHAPGKQPKAKHEAAASRARGGG